MSISKRQIVRAEYLHYRNPARNSDKIFNIFLIQDADDDDFECISEHGRRGSSLVRVIVSSNRPRAAAERDFERKLTAKLNHRDTPYESNPAGARDSRLAREFEDLRTATRSTTVKSPRPKAAAPQVRSKQTGVINREQFESLEF